MAGSKEIQLVIFRLAGEEFGLEISQVPEVLRISESDIDPTPEMIESQVHAEFIKSAGKLKDLDPNAKIVMITVLNEQEAEVVDAIRAGAQGVVSKPIKRDVLVAEVRRVLAV